MARSNVPPASDASAPATPSTASNTHRVTKSRSERSSSSRSCMTRQRSKMLAEASSNGIFQDLVNDADAVAGSSTSASYTGKRKGKGKSTNTAVEGQEWEGYDALMVDAEDRSSLEVKHEEVCPITDKDTKPFPIMNLPTEIRLEIYRACLTRPYNILLSKREQQASTTSDADCADSEGRVAMDGASSEEELLDTVTPYRPLRSEVAAQQNSQSSPRRSNLLNGIPRLASRSARPIRIPSSRSAPGTSGSSRTSANVVQASSTSRRTTAGMFNHSTNSRQTAVFKHKPPTPSGPERPQNQDPLIVNVMLASKDIYKEARSVLYGENLFTLDLATAMPTLACLHQRSRRQIKHVELEIPTYNEILERFQETVRLSLRYCSGLKKIVIHMPFTLPGADGSGTTGNTTVYANGFDILRWLPQECHVILQGNICTEIETVVNKHLHLAKTLDKVRQHIYQYSSHFVAEEAGEYERREQLRKQAEAAASGEDHSGRL